MAGDRSTEIRYGSVQRRLTLALLGLALVAFLIPALGIADRTPQFNWFLFRLQDLPVLLILLFCILALRPAPIARTGEGWVPILAHPGCALGIAFILVLLCWVGHYFVMLDHALSRDEQMVLFDADIFAQGRAFWPIPPSWRPFAEALNQTFILPIGDHEAWVSGYLPINGVLHTLTGVVGAHALAAPLLVGVGAIALWRIGLRLWPESPSATAVALILYASSSQIILTGMTPYAMNAHLALNLVWLALYLNDRRGTDGMALVIGFLATGLHQPVFHPLFVAPFLWQLLAQRRWSRLTLFCVGYAAICLFWLAWQPWIASHGVAPLPTMHDTDPNYLKRLLAILRPPDAAAAWLMALNMLRFATWQHLLLLPLMTIGLRTAWRENGIARALALGMLLLFAAMFLLLPVQGHGWGYRYIHGLLGNACLLGAFGWQRLRAANMDFRRGLIWSTAASVLVILPMHVLMAYQMVEPFAAVDRLIAGSAAPIILVDDKSVPFGKDLVINRADLSNRPIRLMASKLDARDRQRLCAAHAPLFGASALAEIGRYFGQTEATPSPLERACRVASETAASQATGQPR